MSDRLRIPVVGSNEAELHKSARHAALDYFQHPNFRLGPIDARAVMTIAGKPLYFEADVEAVAFDPEDPDDPRLGFPLKDAR